MYPPQDPKLLLKVPMSRSTSAGETPVDSHTLCLWRPVPQYCVLHRRTSKPCTFFGETIPGSRQSSPSMLYRPSTMMAMHLPRLPGFWPRLPVKNRFPEAPLQILEVIVRKNL